MKTLKLCLPYLLKIGTTPMIIGHHGVGKSQGIAQFCADNDYYYVDLRLGTQDVGDLIGLPDHTIDEVSGRKVTQFCTPEWLVKAKNYCIQNPNSKALIFLDEMNRARRDVLQCVFQLVLDGKMHTEVLPENMFVVAAMNPNTQDYIVNDIGDRALLDRFCHIKLAPTPGEWIDYAKSKSFDENLISFISEQREMLRDNLEEFDLSFVKPSPRSWEAVNRLIQAGCPTDLLRELGLGLVGSAAISAYIAYSESADKPFKAEEILNNYPKIAKKLKELSDVNNSRMDLISETCSNIVNHFKKTKLKKLGKKVLKNLITFMEDLPAEKSFDLGRQLFEYNDIRDAIDESQVLEDKWSKARTIDKSTL